MQRKLFLPLLITMFLSLNACAGGGAQGIRVEDVWGRPSPQMAQNGAFYMSIANASGSDDALLDVLIGRCGAVELHETSLDESDVMRMRSVPGGQIPVAAGDTVALRPGGQHVMCIGVDAPLTIGEEVPLTLVFANAGRIEVTADIRQEAP